MQCSANANGGILSTFAKAKKAIRSPKKAYKQVSHTPILQNKGGLQQDEPDMEIETICEEVVDDEVVQHQTHIVRVNEDVVHGDD